MLFSKFESRRHSGMAGVSARCFSPVGGGVGSSNAADGGSKFPDRGALARSRRTSARAVRNQKWFSFARFETERDFLKISALNLISFSSVYLGSSSLPSHRAPRTATLWPFYILRTSCVISVYQHCTLYVETSALPLRACP